MIGGVGNIVRSASFLSQPKIQAESFKKYDESKTSKLFASNMDIATKLKDFNEKRQNEIDSIIKKDISKLNTVSSNHNQENIEIMHSIITSNKMHMIKKGESFTLSCRIKSFFSSISQWFNNIKKKIF